MTLASPARQAPRWIGRNIAVCLLCLGALLISGLMAWSATENFPALTGRVVDQANVIPAANRTAIETKLRDLENKSGIQLVVATVSSLDGQEIEPYANDLFRAWKLGQKDKNNGALLLVAPKEHRVRIEVGYGLEGTLTDALSKVIITNAMVPRLKTNDFGGAIEHGVDDIITTLSTDTSDWQKRPQLRVDKQNQTDDLSPWVVLVIIVIFILILRSQHRGDILSFILGMMANSGGSWSSGGGSGSGNWGGGGGSDDSFSGGGGSSGGGGASGDW